MIDLHPEDHSWLCRVNWTSTSGSKPIGGLEPLARRTPTGWEGISPDEALEAFPDRGGIFWYDVPFGFPEDALVIVRVKREDHYDEGKEAHHVRQWDLPYGVVDLHHLGDDDERRIAATQTGLDVPHPLQRVYIRLNCDEAVGPVPLVRRGDGRYVVPEDQADDLKVIPFSDDDHGSVLANGKRVHVVLDADALGATTRHVNWASDRAVAESIYNRLLKLDRKATLAREMTKDTFRHYVASYPGFDLDSEQRRLQEAARFARVERLVRIVEHDEEFGRRVAEALLGSEAVATQLDGAKQRAVGEAKTQAEAEIEAELAERRRAFEAELEAKRSAADAELASLREALGPMRTTRDELQAETNALQRELDALQQDADARVVDAEAALTARLAALAERPAEAFAEMAVLRALVGSSSAMRPKAGALPEPAGRPEAASAPSDAEEGAVVQTIDSLKQAGGAITQHAKAEDLFAGAALLAGLATGRTAVVAGDGAAALLRTFADIAAGGRVTWIPVSPALSDPADLLTRFDPATGRGTPHPGGLLDAVARARSAPDRLALVVLDGFDRAPAEHYLTTLMACYTEAPYERARTLPYLGTDGRPHRLAWPANLLLACIPSGGPSALPAGPSFWKHAVLVDAGDEATTYGIDLSELAMEAWNEAIDAADGARPISDLSVGFDLAPVVVRTAASFYASAMACNLPEPAAKRLACVAAAVPHARSAEDAVEAVRSVTPPGDPDPEVRTLHLLRTALAQ